MANSSRGPSVGIVTVAYRSNDVLAGFLESVGGAGRARVPIVVVDNAPGDDDARALSAKAGATHIPLPSNPGYGGAVNAGVRELPASVNWIDGGDRFSYTTVNATTRRGEIRRYDPATLGDEPLFQASELTMPGTGQPLAYQSFQWAQDSRNLVFQTDFRPIYRNSGISDFYLFSLADRSVKLAADDAGPSRAGIDFFTVSANRMEALGLHGHEMRLSGNEGRHQFRAVAGGKEAIDVRNYDAFAFVGIGFEYRDFLRVFRTHCLYRHRAWRAGR